MSETEYQRLTDVCSLHGVRNASEGVRYAIECLLHQGDVHPDTTLIEQMRRLEEKIDQLDRELQHIKEALGD